MPADLGGLPAVRGGPTGRIAGWAQQPPAPARDPAEVRERADDILSRRRYDWDGNGDGPFDAVGRWIADRLADLIGATGANVAIPTWAGWVVLALLVALVAWLIVRNGSGLRFDRPVVDRGDVVLEEGEERVDWAAAADRAEAAGNWAEGLRCRYRALAGGLAARGVIAELVGRTAGEWAADVRTAAPAAGEPFAAATDLFERAWYGGEATGSAERDRFATLAAEVLAAAPATARRRRASAPTDAVAVPS